MRNLPLAAFLGFAVSSVFTAGTVLAEDPQHVVLNPGDLKWGDGPPTLPKGVKVAALHGDPAKDGAFSVMFKMPAGYKIPAHWHSQDENIVVISGVFYAGMGDKLDAKKSLAVKPGAYVFMPAKMHHYAFAKGPAVIELHGNGPFDINYINPAEDPTKQH